MDSKFAYEDGAGIKIIKATDKAEPKPEDDKG
jgi:hypothetical protein